MATSSSSLVVRISADITDFSKQLDAATRGVDRAAKKIEGFGRALTLGITVPVAAAAVALAKMAAENEDTAGRMSRVFGSAADSVNASIKKMMSSVPESNTELQKMAISVDNMAQGLGIAPGNAAKMSESLLKLAGDASAFAHVPMEQALDAISRGLAGRTKGLLEFGIAISEADIKAKALAMGLVHQGNTLTETGTALAAYALIMEKSARITGEAERTAGQAGKQFAFLRRDLGELADNVSHLVLPALSDLATKARTVVDWFSKLDDSTVKTFFNIAAAAAIIGPAIAIFANLVKGVFAVRAAFLLLGEGGGIAAVIGGLASLPFTTIVLGVGAIATAVGLLVIAWEKLHKQDKSDFVGPRNVLSPLSGSDPALNAALQINHTPDPGALARLANANATNAPTERAPIVDAMKALEDRAANVTTALKQMAQGFTIPGLTTEWFNTLGAVETALAKIGNAMDPIAVTLRGIVNDLKSGAAAAFATPPSLASLSSLPGVAGAVRSGVTINPQVAELPGLTAANEAAMRYAKTQEYVTETIAYDYQALRSQLSQFGINLSNVGERMQGVILTIADAATNFAIQLANRAGGSGKGAQTGRGIGGFLGAAVGFVGGPVGSAIGGIIGTAAGGLIGGLFDHAKSSTDKAAESMANLAKTVERVNSSITNVPAWFKVQTYRFMAAPTLVAGPPPTATPSGGYTPPPMNTPTPIDPNAGTGLPGANVVHVHGNIVLPGVANYQDFVREMAFSNLRARNTGNVASFAFG